jgi:hypothetical protein
MSRIDDQYYADFLDVAAWVAIRQADIGTVAIKFGADGQTVTAYLRYGVGTARFRGVAVGGRDDRTIALAIAAAALQGGNNEFWAACRLPNWRRQLRAAGFRLLQVV